MTIPHYGYTIQLSTAGMRTKVDVHTHWPQALVAATNEIKLAQQMNMYRKITFDHGANVNVCIHHITSHHITLHYITLHFITLQTKNICIYIYLQLHSTPHSLQVQKVPRFCTALHPGGPESHDDFPLPSSLRKGG
jgi:hypothetical protein